MSITPPAIESWEVLDLLSSLVQKSLVAYEAGEQGQGRYHLLETVRQYGRDRLSEAGEAEALRERHRDWFLSMAERAEPETRGRRQTTWLDRLEQEHANLRAALEWCHADEHGTEAGLRLAGMLERFWWLRSHMSEGRIWLETALARPGASARTVWRGRALAANGIVAWNEGDYAVARASFEAGAAIFRELEDRAGLALALCWLGLTLQSDDPATGRALQEESVGICREIEDRRGLAWGLIALGEGARLAGDDARAAALYEEGLAVCRDLEDRQSLAMALHNLGCVRQRQGEHRRAAALFTEALALAGELEAKYAIVSCLAGLADTAALAGRPERGARLLGAAGALQMAIGYRIEPADQPYYEADVAAVCAGLDDAAYAALWAERQAMPLDQAVRYALAEGDSGGATPGADHDAA